MSHKISLHHHHRHHHHPKHHDSWEGTNDHQGSTFSNAHLHAIDPPKRLDAPEYDVAAPVCVKVGDQKICKESIDAAAEEFIKLEHKKFQFNNWMSFKAD